MILFVVLNKAKPAMLSHGIGFFRFQSFRKQAFPGLSTKKAGPMNRPGFSL